MLGLWCYLAVCEVHDRPHDLTFVAEPAMFESVVEHNSVPFSTLKRNRSGRNTEIVVNM